MFHGRRYCHRLLAKLPNLTKMIYPHARDNGQSPAPRRTRLCTLNTTLSSHPESMESWGHLLESCVDTLTSLTLEMWPNVKVWSENGPVGEPIKARAKVNVQLSHFHLELYNSYPLDYLAYWSGDLAAQLTSLSLQLPPLPLLSHYPHLQHIRLGSHGWSVIALCDSLQQQCAPLVATSLKTISAYDGPPPTHPLHQTAHGLGITLTNF